MSVAFVICDAEGVCTTVKVNRKLEEQDAGHLERALIVLSATYYEQFIKPNMEATKYAVVAPGEEPPNGGSTH